MSRVVLPSATTSTSLLNPPAVCSWWIVGIKAKGASRCGSPFRPLSGRPPFILLHFCLTFRRSRLPPLSLSLGFLSRFVIFFSLLYISPSPLAPSVTLCRFLNLWPHLKSQTSSSPPVSLPHLCPPFPLFISSPRIFLDIHIYILNFSHTCSPSPPFSPSVSTSLVPVFHA